MAKGICLLDKKAFFFCLYRNNFKQVRAFERHIPLNDLINDHNFVIFSGLGVSESELSFSTVNILREKA